MSVQSTAENLLFLYAHALAFIFALNKGIITPEQHVELLKEAAPHMPKPLVRLMKRGHTRR